MREYNKGNIVFAKELRKNMTPQEKHIWYDYLRDYPVRFQRQKALGNYIADFFCARAKLIIEIDGSGHGTDEQRKIDNERTEYLESVGLLVIRFTNEEVNNKFRSVCIEIDRAVKKRLEKE
ncbi:MAG: endonuclease domain-containing protein [Clostridia bacterium]|nr:endonuclease domain-containing protein [Clostridia bacterium]